MTMILEPLGTRGHIGRISGQRIAAFLEVRETSRQPARVDWALYCDDARGSAPDMETAVRDAMAAHRVRVGMGVVA
jgi:hypothetical protein